MNSRFNTTNYNEESSYLQKYPEILDIFKVFEMGAKKHGDEGWLQNDSPTMSLKKNSDSRFHHLAKTFSGEVLDESGLDHDLHIACRSIMSYIRRQRGIVHPDDKKPEYQHQKMTGENCISIEENLERHKNSPYYRGEE